MPEYDISYGNVDITPEVFTTRVFGLDDRWALRAALDELAQITGADGQPAAWTVIDVQEVPVADTATIPPTITEGADDGTA